MTTSVINWTYTVYILICPCNTTKGRLGIFLTAIWYMLLVVNRTEGCHREWMDGCKSQKYSLSWRVPTSFWHILLCSSSKQVFKIEYRHILIFENWDNVYYVCFCLEDYLKMVLQKETETGMKYEEDATKRIRSREEHEMKWDLVKHCTLFLSS